MGIETLLYMIPKGGKYAKSVVNFVHKAVKDWPKFKLEIEKVLNGLKGGKLRLDGKQKTIFESNKNTLKAHEKVTKKVEVSPVKKEDLFKGWTPTLVERSNLRNIFKDKIDPPKAKYTKEMEKIDEELDALVFGGKYDNLGGAKKAKIFEKLQTDMNKLIKAATKEDLTSLSLGQLNKKSQLVQKRIREISNDPNIKGTVSEGPKADMIDAIYTKEATAIRNASQFIKRKNVKTKYGDKFPRLDPDNNAFIITGLDTAGNPIKVSRFTGKFSAAQDWKTGDLTRKEGTAWWDRWDPKKNQLRKEGEEVWHETVDAEGKTIMSNPDYQVTTKNIDIWNNINNDVSINELSKQGHKLKDIDMLLKGKEVRKYLEAQKAAEPKLGIYEKMHERTESGQISEIMEDLYIRGDDIYKMTIKEWTKKIPEYFAGGGSVSGFATGGISNLFRERQGYRSGEAVIKLAKGARWLIRMLKEMSDDMIFGQKQFAKMTEALKMKYFKETQSAIKHLEAGGEIPENLIQTMRNDPRFKGLTVSTKADKDFLEMHEVVLGKLPKGKGEIIEGKAAEKGTGEKLLKGEVVDEELELWGFMDQLPKELQHKVALLPIEKQIPLLKKFKEAVDAVKTGGTEKGIEVLQEQLLKDFIPKGQPHATGGLIDGYATGGVSNLFRSR